jgi:diguanylate cyclase (GGDEF)-like protein
MGTAVRLERLGQRQLVGVELVGLQLVGLEVVGFQWVGVELVRVQLDGQLVDRQFMDGDRVGMKHMRAMLGARGRVWLLTAVVWTLAVVTFVSLPHGAVSGAHTLPGWLFVLMFGAAEVCVVHVHFRGDAHSFSLSEIPLVLGMFCAAPRPLVVAQLVGAALALVVHRRQSVQKLAFNLGQFALSGSAALLLFHRLGGRTPLDSSAWLMAGGAALLSALIGVVAIVTVISVSQGRLLVDRLSTVAVLVGAGAATNSSVGALAAWIAWRDPVALVLLLLPTGTLLAAYRAFVVQRRRIDGLRFIHESTRILHASPELDHSVLDVLAHACEMVRAETAEIILFSPTDDEVAVRWRVGGEGGVETTDAVTLGPADLYLAAVAVRGDAATLTTAREDATIRPALERRGIRDAIVAGLRSESRMIGLLVIGNRLGEMSTFDRQDVRLIDTLSRHLAVALENGQLERSLSQLRTLQQRLTDQAFHDSLTGLANRTLLTERIDHALRRRGDEPVAILFIDLDDFKTVNDSLGHAAGDELLKAVAERLRGCLRPSDTPARLGGDEFAVFLEDPGGLGEAMTVAERILSSLSSAFHLQGSSVHVGGSIGIAMGIPGEKAADELLSDADLALYTAKMNGKATFEIFQPRMREAVQHRHSLKMQLKRAVANEEFVVQYQPIVRLGRRRIAGAEALVRWQTPTEGMLFPDSFIPLAEESGLISDIGSFVLERACRDAHRWSPDGTDGPLGVSVNLSPRQLVDPRFAERVLDTLRRCNLPPSALMLEITETTLMRDSVADVDKLQELRALGVRLAIDDFGTGYSSMSYLRQFPIDVLKVAKPFVDGLGTSAADASFTEAIVRLGQSLGVDVIAEGISDPVQLELLESMGCQFGQGFLFSPAIDAPAFSRLEPDMAAVPTKVLA